MESQQQSTDSQVKYILFLIFKLFSKNWNQILCVCVCYHLFISNSVFVMSFSSMIIVLLMCYVCYSVMKLHKLAFSDENLFLWPFIRVGVEYRWPVQ